MTERRLIVGPCRSGSTALLHAFSQHPNVNATYQPIKTGLRENGNLNYGFYEGHLDVKGKGFTVGKETVGHSSMEECLLQIFRTKADIIATRPIFVLRNTISTYKSWLALNWGSLDKFLAAYHHTLNMLQICLETSDKVKLVMIEDLVNNPKQTIEALCLNWGLDYIDQLTTWPNNLSAANGIQRSMPKGSEKGFAANHHKFLRESQEFLQPSDPDVNLPQDVIGKIEESLHSRIKSIKNECATLQ